MRIAPKVKCQRVLVLALYLVDDIIDDGVIDDIIDDIIDDVIVMGMLRFGVYWVFTI